MRLTYETGVATLVQFIVLTLLNFINGIASSAQECHGNSTDCVSTIILSLLFFMVITGWFAILMVTGYAAQDRRSQRIAQLLFCAEGLVALVSLFDAKHHPNVLGLITSLVDAVLAVWVMVLAWRLMRAKGGRVVSKQRPRQRRRTTS